MKQFTGAAGALALTGRQGSAAAQDHSQIQHIVVAMMENRSFDHMLGWLPSADGKQAGLTYFDRNNQPHQTYHLSDYQGCGHPVPDNTYQGAHVEYDNGLCDGWLKAGTNDDFVMGYYTQKDLAFLGEAAPRWTVCDRYFAATLAETYPNRMFQHAAQTDRLDNSLAPSTLPTIWDRLADAGVSGRYYYSDIPFLVLWGAKYLPISRHFDDFEQDCAAGTLPSVSFVDPRFLGEAYGLSNDDHPHSDIRNGEAFLNRVYSAVTKSPLWPNTVLIINFDEWGGFFDHVPPPVAPDPNPSTAERGFRVPCLVISPWSRPGKIAHDVYDHASVLKMIESRWNLAPLTVRDASANNLADTLELNGLNRRAPSFAVPPGPFGSPCFAGASTTEWEALAELALRSGWPLFG